MKSIYYLIIPLSSILIACSSLEETTHTKQRKPPEIFVFKDLIRTDSVKTDNLKTDTTKQQKNISQPANNPVTKPSSESVSKFYIQMGVFATKERAEAFVNEYQSEIVYLMNIALRDSDKRFVVRLKPFFTKEEAEKVRNSIKQFPAFKDAFITTVD